MDDFTLCRHEVHGGEALLATAALDHWAALGWQPATQTPTPKRGRKAAAPPAGDNHTEQE